LGIAAVQALRVARDNRKHRLTHREPRDACADLFHDTGDIAAWDHVRQAVRVHRIFTFAFAPLPVHRIDRCRIDTNQNLALVWNEHRNALEFKDVRASNTVLHNCLLL
jgi:hypothetical protein